MSGLDEARAEINKVIKGKSDIVDKLLMTMIAGGHLLLEDIPGVGKTTLAVTAAAALSLEYTRVQFTPDVLPSDVVGFSMYNAGTKQFEYRPGAIMCNLFLADEINRTSPKTQSSLLEVMEEGHVTVDGVTRPVPEPFMVIATENPTGSAGTQMLPDSQLDRFMTCLSMGYPSHDDAVDILRDNKNDLVSHVSAVMSKDQIQSLRTQCNDMFVHDSILDYITTIVEKTRGNDSFVNGASPRAAISMLRMSKASAVLSGRDYVVPEDVRAVVFDVLRHRLKMSTKAKASSVTFEKSVDDILSSVRIPRT